jgi:ABC-2 type transport system ATP-binding protein
VGKATVLGYDPQADGLAVRRLVGYLPEQPALYDWMTVGELGWFASGFYGGQSYLNDYRRLTDELAVPWDKKLKALSKGTRAKAALALALAQQPELLVLDEPTSGLDLLVRHEILDRMVDLAAAGRTVLLSSHQVAEVERVADTVAIIHHGKLVVLDSLDELKQQTQELVLTLNNGTVPPTLPGEMLRSRQHARQWQVLVRGCPPETVERLRADSTIGNVDVRRPGLEEIVAGYLRSKPGELSPLPAATKEVRP